MVRQSLLDSWLRHWAGSGLTMRAPSGRLKRAMSFVGTEGYMAPEVPTGVLCVLTGLHGTGGTQPNVPTEYIQPLPPNRNGRSGSAAARGTRHHLGLARPSRCRVVPAGMSDHMSRAAGGLGLLEPAARIGMLGTHGCAACAGLAEGDASPGSFALDFYRR
jgi:hypothetical protein